MNSIGRGVIGLVVFATVAAIFLEFASFLLSKSGLLLVNDTPLIYMGISNEVRSGSAWRNEREAWGAWHKINAKADHIGECFSVTYESNSVGARDHEFLEKSTRRQRYVLLGDSFAEGFGVEAEGTAKSLLEGYLGIDVMNFGASGDLGPLQYWLLYRELAGKFEHSGLIIFFNPTNDFIDNDYEIWERYGWTYLTSGNERYRPYSRKIENSKYTFFYPGNAIKRNYWDEDAGRQEMFIWFARFLKQYTWSSNVFRTAKIVYEQRIRFNVAFPTTSHLGVPVTRSYSGYFDATEEQQHAAIYWLAEIVRNTTAARIVIVSVPTRNDLARIGDGARPALNLWHRTLREFEGRSSGRVKFIDLADFAPSQYEHLFLACDGHWSPAGSKWAAESIASQIQVMD